MGTALTAVCHQLLHSATGSVDGRNQTKHQDVSILTRAPPQLERLRHLAMGCSPSAEPVPASSGCSLAPQDCLAASTCHASNHTGVPCWPWHRRAQRQQNRPSEGEGISQVLQKCHMKRPKNGSDRKKQTIPVAECFCSSAKKLKFAQVKVGG